MPADPDLLRELAARAALVDQLDAEASQSSEPYADAQLDATLVAKRDRLLIELDVAGVLDPAQAALRAQLARLALPALVAYHDAAVAMDRYLGSVGYVRLVKQARPARLLDARVSLDWFRVPSGYVARGLEAHDWLALCEASFRAHDRPRAGSAFVRLEGAFHRLLFRTELGAPRLYRALPA